VSAVALLDQARARLDAVCDPEIPVVSIAELGILRDVRLSRDGAIVVEITPTYSGCPAVDTITDDIQLALADLGAPARVERSLSPAWTTDWISAAGREKLRAYGIAPPMRCAAATNVIALHASDEVVACPLCASTRTRVVSHYGSTACKALYRCMACSEPFDYFKPH
jgi:ring-1,2-phenylacetyl-CoA epoxidase subunit PaaD